MKITVKKLSELHKPAHNIRRHSEKQLTEYIRSIEMFGQSSRWSWPRTVRSSPVTVCMKRYSAWAGKPVTAMSWSA